MVAFTSARSDHSFIGIHRFGDDNIQYLDPSFDGDVLPAWSPDGAMVAWVRLRSVTNDAGQEKNTPFTVHMYSRATRQTKIVYSDSTAGWPTDYGFGNRQPAWINNTHFAFNCEASGWLHVCAASLDGSVVDMSPGSCEVQDFVVGDGVVFVSDNCEKLNSRGVAAIDSSGQRTFVAGGSDHVIAGMADGGSGMAVVPSGVAFLQQTVNISASVFVATLSASGAKVSPVDSGDRLPVANVVPKPITFPSGSLTINGQLFVKPGASKGPALIFTHGGPRRQMYNGYHYCEDYAMYYATNQYFASLGYTVLSINYRLGIGYGTKFRRAEGGKWLGASEYQVIAHLNGPVLTLL